MLGDDYKNDWICLGSDIDTGDGQIVEVAEDMLRAILGKYPTIIVYQAWWDSFEGVKARELLANSIQGDDVQEYLESENHFEDIYDKTARLIFSGLSTSAENAFLQWKEHKEN